MAQRGFMQTVADAARAISAFTATLRAEAGEPSQPASASAITWHGHMWQFTGSATANLDCLGGRIAEAVCQYLLAMALLAMQHTMAHHGSRTEASNPQVFSVTPETSSTLGSLVASGLVAAAAATVVDCPCAAGLTHISLSRAACNAARAMALLAGLQESLASHGGQEGRRLACGLLRATRHVAVRRLQVALLDQLAAHAGMGAELGGGQEGRQEEEQEQGGRQNQAAQEQEDEGQQAQERRASEAPEQQGPPTRVRAQEPGAGGQERLGERGQEPEQQVHEGQARAGCPGPEEADGWAGSSGVWWFAREEAQRGELLGAKDGEEEPVAGSPTAGWLESRHCGIVSATLLAWQAAEVVQLEEEERVPAAPPPVLRARLAARAAEALCRLCRGQGLEGAYAPAPQWEFATVQVRALVEGGALSCSIAWHRPSASAVHSQRALTRGSAVACGCSGCGAGMG